MPRPGGTLVIDNNDSFTWNLVHLLEALGDEPRVLRADRFDESEDTRNFLVGCRPERLLISPGPGEPKDAALSNLALELFLGRHPILGVCLGHQCLGVREGAELTRAPSPVHGKVHSIRHDGSGIFEGLPDPLKVTRYHSLMIDGDSLPESLQASAWTIGTDPEVLMALKHRDKRAEGVQFHPESFLTEGGRRMMENFLSWV